MTKLIKKFLRGGTADEIYRASYSLPTITIKSNRTPENYQKALNARESEFYQNLIRRVAMNRATNIDYKWLKDNGITSEELNKDVAAHQLNVSNPIRELLHQKKINEEQQIKGIQNRENYEGLRKAITVAPFAPFAPYLVSSLGESLVTAPIQTVGNFATGMLGGAAVNKATGGWGNMLGEKLGIPEASNILDYTNPGYFVGFPTKVIANVAGNLADKLPSNMVDRLLPSRVAVTPEGVRVPVNSGNSRTMNFGERVKGAIKGAVKGFTNAKPKTSTSEPIPNLSTRPNELSYYDYDGNQIRLFEPTNPKEEYFERLDKKAYEKIPQDKEIYDLNTGDLVDINNAVPEGKYMYSDMTPATVFKEVQNPNMSERYYLEGRSYPSSAFYEINLTPSSNLENVVTSKGTPASNVFREITPKNANRYKTYMNEYGDDVYTLYDSPLPQNRRLITPTGEELVPDAEKLNLYKAYKALKDLSKVGNRKILHLYTSQRLGTPLRGTVVNDPINQDVLEYVRRTGPWLPGNKYFNTLLGTIIVSGAATRKNIGKGLNWWFTGDTTNNQQTNNQQTNNQQQEPEYFSIEDAKKMVEDSWNE